jgi:hypothetical protein
MTKLSEGFPKVEALSLRAAAGGEAISNWAEGLLRRYAPRNDKRTCVSWSTDFGKAVKLNRSGSLFRALLILTAILPMLGRAPSALAAGATFKVTVKSAFLRSEPSLSGARVASVFRNQVYPVTGRNGDNSWLQLNGTGWISSALGEVRGDLSAAPVLADAAAPSAPPPASAPTPAAGDASNTPGMTLRLTITAKSAYVRTAPTWGGARSGSVFKGQAYTAVGRSTDATWVQIQHGNRLGWVAASVGKLSGDISLLAATDYVAPGQTNSAWASGGSSSAPWIPVINPYMRLVYEAAPQSGHSLNMFAVVGDCNSESPVYLQRVREGRFSFQGHEELRATVDFFWEAFKRDSLATYGSFNTASVLNPDWGHPAYCEDAEGAFQCELRWSNASVVFIALGTGDQYIWRDSEKRYRTMIEHALQRSVLPVLVTKADALESAQGGAEPDYLNSLMRRLAQEYQVPLLDFWLASRNLPGYGLQADGFHLNEDGINLHILVTLQTLEAIWRK